MSTDRLVWNLSLLAWSAGIVAVGLAYREEVPEKRIISVVDVRWSPDSASTLERAAMVELSKAPSLMESRVGYIGVVPEEVRAWRLLRESPRASRLFQQLLDGSTLPGRLYALAGLQAIESRKFEEAFTAIGLLTLQHVQTTHGCLVQEEPLETVLAEVRSGWWSRELENAR